jgi:outer membrane immunogenic protein
MKLVLLVGVAVCAFALADVAVAGVFDPAPAYSLPPEYNWTGLYVGMTGGAALGRASWESDPDLAAGTINRSSGVGGVTLGYNAQNLGRLVAGTEFDFNWRNFDAMVPAATCGGPPCEFKSSWFSTARVRFGYQVDRFLPYVTGGLSISNFDSDIVGQPNGVSHNLSFNFVAGAGLEFAIIGGLTGKLEYLYVNHDNIGCVEACNGPVNLRLGENVIRAGLNYRLWER